MTIPVVNVVGMSVRTPNTLSLPCRPQLLGLCSVTQTFLAFNMPIIRDHLVVSSSPKVEPQKVDIKRQQKRRDPRLLKSLNQMQARGRLHDMAHFAGFELESGIFKLLLHISSAEVTQVAHLPCATAV